ncbi:MoaD/ThiS family protein [Helicovermis profundi]|uniref:MoaD/ThiS family protein n=1 Tax=Helicovermis profundi TaxID=3065157 RepID=A0AAU9E8S1_9FIRM|nr:MoaD/ThiS family protein [Clostridia bacterium S502]
MKIEIRLFATFRQGRFKTKVKEFDSEIKVTDVLEYLNISKDDVAILLINGRDGKFNSLLEDEDKVSLFPPVGGG